MNTPAKSLQVLSHTITTGQTLGGWQVQEITDTHVVLLDAESVGQVYGNYNRTNGLTRLQHNSKKLAAIVTRNLG